MTTYRCMWLVGLVVAGCSASAERSAPEGDSAESEIRTRLVGAYVRGDGHETHPLAQGIVFKQDGTFFADVDTGIRCITTPCPSGVRVAGTFSTRGSRLTLSPRSGEAPSDFHGVYSARLRGDSLILARAGRSQTLRQEVSYCAEVSDCSGQNLVVPRCLGYFTCETNQCAYRCGSRPIWPATATALDYRMSGGFVRPGPDGSECGASDRHFSLDVATRTLRWEVCKVTDWQIPFVLDRGSKVLSTAEFQKVESTLSALSIVHSDMCGADKPFTVLTVATPSGAHKYYDSFYACLEQGDYLDDIGSVGLVLEELAR